MGHVEVTTIEISPEGHYASLNGCIANEQIRIELLRKEKEVVLRKLMKLDEAIEEENKILRTHMYAKRKLEENYGFTVDQESQGTLSDSLHWSLTGHDGQNQARRFDLYQRLSTYDTAR